MKKIDPVALFSMITIISFILYERYLGKIIMFFHIPFIPHTRTIQAAITKYLPLMVLLTTVCLLMKKFYKEDEEKNSEDNNGKEDENE